MKSRTFYSAIALVAGFLLLVGVGGFWGLTAQNPRILLTQGGQEQPLAAQFVPRQSPLMISLLARPDRLWQLRQLLTPANQRFEARQEWQFLQRSLEDLVGWNYEADVRPWLDEEATFAVTGADLDHDASNGLQPGYLVILSCRDVVAAREALHRLWQQRAAQRSLVFETVSSIPLISDRPSLMGSLASFSPPSSDLALDTLATAMVGDRYVLLANDGQVLRQAIAAYRAPDVNWAQAAPYHEAIATLPANRVGWMVANIPSLLNWLGIEDTSVLQPIKPDGRQASLLFISFQALADGLLGNTAIATAAPSATASMLPPPTTSSSSIAPLTLLPDSTLFATAGADLSQQLQSLSHNIGGYQITQQAIAALLQAWSLDAPTAPAELATALQGEYALGRLPGSPSDWALIAQSATADFATVDAFAAAQGLTVNQITNGDQPITAWTRLSLSRVSSNAPLQLTTQVVAVHTPVQNYEVVSTSLAGLQQILQQSNQGSLENETTFAHLVEQLASPGQELAYLDWPALLPTLTQQLPWLRVIAGAAQPLSRHLGPILISSQPSSSSLTMGAIAIQLRENPAKMS
ncbi:MAG: DUF3352 domain-containing protein [Leptolyngbya sp. SIOISBB]|nr:DUF3352 domain-containing protein [Leptolyngbya sp. SIOISBB]